MKDKEIIIKYDGAAFVLEVKGLSDIEVLGLLTAYKNRIELELLNDFKKQTKP